MYSDGEIYSHTSQIDAPDSNYSSSMSSLSSTNDQQGESALNLTTILNLFLVSNTRNSRRKIRASPKKENLNGLIIKGIKNMFRLIIYNKKTIKCRLRIDPRNIEQNRRWVELGEIYRENPVFITEIARTDVTSDCIRNGLSEENMEEVKIERSINTSYCRNFYSNELLIRAYKALMGIFFSEIENDKLSNRFGFRCCESEEHLESCNDKYLQSFDMPSQNSTLSNVKT